MYHWKWKLGLSIGLLLAGLSMAGCSSSEEPTPTTTNKPPEAPPANVAPSQQFGNKPYIQRTPTGPDDMEPTKIWNPEWRPRRNK